MSKKLFSPSVALVYDRVNTPYGGAENVLLALHRAFPTAPLFTALYSPKHAPWAAVFPAVKASFLSRLPFLRSAHRWLAWLMPLAFESLDFSGYDLVISVTSAEAKGILTKPDQLHLCYLLTPPRYLYQSKEHSLNSHWLLRLPLIRQLATIWLNYLRWWDQAAIFRPDHIWPISKRVTTRVKQFYPTIRPGKVIYPPIEILNTQQLSPTKAPTKPYFLIISRLVSHKRLDLAIQACARLDKNLVIVGKGPDLPRLRRLAKTSEDRHAVQFLTSVDQQILHSLYAHCQALIMPGEEDFGIVALEANDFGKPVIINQKSGAAELIKPAVHGIYIKAETVEAVESAIHEFEQTSFSASKIRQNPLKYDTNRFIREFSAAVQAEWEAHQANV